MKKVFVLILLAFFACESTSEAVGKGSGKKLDVLVIGFNSSDLSPINEFATHMPNYTFNTHNGAVANVTQTQLNAYDVVLLFTNHTGNAKAIGDTVYHYAVSGGHLLLATFYTAQASTFGLLKDIDPLNGTTRNGADTLEIKSSHLLTRGMTGLISNYSAGATTLVDGATKIHNWKSGDIFAAEHSVEKGRVLQISQFPIEHNYNTVMKQSGDKNIENFFRLWSNAIRYVYEHNAYDNDFKYIVKEEEGGKEGGAF